MLPVTLQMLSQPKPSRTLMLKEEISIWSRQLKRNLLLLLYMPTQTLSEHMLLISIIFSGIIIQEYFLIQIARWPQQTMLWLLLVRTMTIYLVLITTLSRILGVHIGERTGICGTIITLTCSYFEKNCSWT